MSTSNCFDESSCWPPARVLVCAHPETASTLQIALRKAGLDATISDGTADALPCADLIICDPQSWATRPVVRHQSAPFREPLVVVTGAETGDLLALLEAGADLVLCGEVQAEAVALQVRILLLRLQFERDRNPLTGLPGNRRLQAHLERVLSEGGRPGLLLLDIDGFKQFNDRHGHLMGDAAIALLAECATEAARRSKSIVIHVGGDDYCLITTPDQMESIAREIQTLFERRMAGCPPADGEELPSLTAVGTTVDDRSDLASAFERLAALKQRAKAQPGSTCMIDHR